MVAEGRDDRQPPPGAGDGDIEAPLAALLIERAEPVRKLSRAVLAIADRQEDRVPLVALDSLQVLDEEPVGAGLVEEGIQVRT